MVSERSPRTLAARAKSLSTKGSLMLQSAIDNITQPTTAKLDADLARAQSAHAAAEERVDLAVAAFDHDDNSETVAELEAARADAARTGDRLARATRILGAARSAQAVAERNALIDRRAALRSDLTNEAIAKEQAPLVRREAEILIELAHLRAQRHEVEATFALKAAEIDRLTEQLGEPAANRPMSVVHAPRYPVVALLQGFANTRQRGDLVRRFVEEIARDMSP